MVKSTMDTIAAAKAFTTAALSTNTNSRRHISARNNSVSILHHCVPDVNRAVTIACLLRALPMISAVTLTDIKYFFGGQVEKIIRPTVWEDGVSEEDYVERIRVASNQSKTILLADLITHIKDPHLESEVALKFAQKLIGACAAGGNKKLLSLARKLCINKLDQLGIA